MVVVITSYSIHYTKLYEDRIRKRGIEHLAIDEAHCVAEWGDSFRPAYLELGELVRALNPPAVTAFTATASPPVLGRVAEIRITSYNVCYTKLLREYRKLLETYFGPGMRFEAESDLEGMRIPHFYNAFYVYKYATGISASLALVITSYSIHYTKLYDSSIRPRKRVPGTRERTPASGPSPPARTGR